MSTPNKPKPWKPKEVSDKARAITIHPTIPLESNEAVGHVIAQALLAWSNGERKMVEIMAYATEAEEWVVAEMFEKLRNVRPRASAIRERFTEKLGKEASDEIYENFLTPFLNMSDARNDLAHGYFIQRSDHPNALILKKGWGKKSALYLYDLETLQALRDEIIRCSQLIEQVRQYVLMTFPPKYASGALIAASNPHLRPPDHILKKLFGDNPEPPEDPQE